EWLEAPGLPDGFPEFRAERFEAIDREARDWLGGRLATGDLPAATWSTQEWLHFLNALPERVDTTRLAELDAAFGLTRRPNAEIAAAWFLVAIRNDYKPADARLEEFLTTIGRRKFLMPLYGELAKTPAGKARARAIYARARPSYHPISAESVDRLLGAP